MKAKEHIKTVRVSNKSGIHARTAARIVETVSKSNSQLFIKKNDKEVEASNILSILTLDCPKGTELQLRAVGEDSKELLNRITKILQKGIK